MDYQLEELSLELTNECTLACIHCSSGSSPEKLSNELTYDEHISLITQARELGATVLSLSGGNPLLYDNLNGLVDWATKVGYERILIYTTGHNEYGSHIANCMSVHDHKLRNNILTWIFSFHSTDMLINNHIMGIGAGQAIVKSMGWLIENNQDVEVHMVPMKPNFRNIPHMREFCGLIGVKKLSLLRFVPQTRGLDNIDELGMDKADFILMQIMIDKEMKKDSPVELRAGCPIDFRHSVGLLDEKAKPCHAADDLMLVRPTGDVHPCAAWKSLPADSNVRDQPLRYIWDTSETFNFIRRFKYHDEYCHMSNFQKVEGCRFCDKLYSCQTGCLAQRLHAYSGDGLETLLCDWSDPLCPRGVQPSYRAWPETAYYEGPNVAHAPMILGIDKAEGESQSVAVVMDGEGNILGSGSDANALMDSFGVACVVSDDPPCEECEDEHEGCRC